MQKATYRWEHLGYDFLRRAQICSCQRENARAVQITLLLPLRDFLTVYRTFGFEGRTRAEVELVELNREILLQFEDHDNFENVYSKKFSAIAVRAVQFAKWFFYFIQRWNI